MPNTIAFALLALALGGLGGKMPFRRAVRAHATPPASDQANEPTPDAAYAHLDAYLERQLAALNIPGAALVIVEGAEIVHVRTFGRAGPDGQAPTPQTPFFIGSLTKSVTAVAVMQLVEAGKVELDAPVQRYLPWFRVANPQATAQLTVRHLLNQTSGFAQAAGMLSLADFDDQLGATERQARALATYRPARLPGVAWEYSNVNYNLLGLIIEAASGESYADYVQNHMFAPLEMRHSHTTKAAAQQDGLAVGHRAWFGWPVAAPVSDYLPADMLDGIQRYKGTDYSHQLKVFQLVNQTSGLADFEVDKPRGGKSMLKELMAGHDRAVDTAEALAITRRLAPHFPPGTLDKAYYSNLNYRLLGEMIWRGVVAGIAGLNTAIVHCAGRFDARLRSGALRVGEQP